MRSADEVAKHILSISDDRYFNDTGSLFLDMELKLADTEFRGLAINAPQRIATQRQGQLPIIMAIQETGLRAWEFPRDTNCVVAATEMGTRTVYFGQVFRDAKAETFAMPPDAQRPPRPEGADAVALSSGVSRFDARAVLALPWHPGRYRLEVVMFDRVSNAVAVTLDGDAPQPPVSAPAAAPTPAAPGQGHGMPTYLPAASVPAPTGDTLPAVLLTVQPNPEPGIKLAVRGAFALLAEPIHLPPAPCQLMEVDGETKEVGAVVPATLAVFGKDWPTPLRFDWALPVYAPSAIKPGDRIQGHFAIDPLAGSPMALPPGDYAAYLMIEGRLFGPFRFSTG